jgi:hypothetical protein
MPDVSIPNELVDCILLDARDLASKRIIDVPLHGVSVNECTESMSSWRWHTSVSIAGPPVVRQRSHKDGRSGTTGTRRGELHYSRQLSLANDGPMAVAATPSVRVARCTAIGAILVHDRLADEQYVIYTPCSNNEFASGLGKGRWYVRRSRGRAPSSFSFNSWWEAVDAVVGRCWQQEAC